MAAKNVLLFLCFIIFIANSKGLKCYTCTVNIGDIDQRCVSDPGSVQSGQSITNCNKEYCTSKRVEYKDPPNKVHSMHRGCESDPGQMNTIDEDDTFITYYTACRYDLCNGGNGKGGDGGIGFDPETGAEEVLLVRGNNSGVKMRPGYFGTYVLLGIIAGIFVIYIG